MAIQEINHLKPTFFPQESLIKSHSDIVRRLIQEHEERITELKRAHKQDLEKFHCDEEIKLAMEFRNKEKKLENELSSMKSTYEDELFQLKKCCQDTLNEQVCLAKADAFNILQKQIQVQALCIILIIFSVFSQDLTSFRYFLSVVVGLSVVG